LDYEAARRDPKLLVGFSDITALQLAMWTRVGLAGVHGPMAAWNAERTGPASAESLRRAVMTTDELVLVPRIDSTGRTEETATVVIGGAPVTGTLLGGNLCLLTATIGTVDLPDLHGAILLLEEVDEPPYKVDRMLTHLWRAGVLAGVAGVAVGQFTNCADG